MTPSPEPSRRQHWDRIAELSIKWLGEDCATPLPAGSGAVRAAEQRLGVSVPAAIREFHERFGGSLESWSAQDHLFAPERWRFRDDDLVLGMENQGNYLWLIPTAHLEEPNPPVVRSDLDDDRRLHVAAESFTGFVESWLLLTAKFSAKRLFRANGQPPDAVCAVIRRSIERIVPTRLCWPVLHTELFGDDRVIIEIDDDSWIWVTAQDADAFEVPLRLAEAAGMEWESLESPRS